MTATRGALLACVKMVGLGAVSSILSEIRIRSPCWSSVVDVRSYCRAVPSQFRRWETPLNCLSLSITRRPLGRGWTPDNPGDADTHYLTGLSSESNCLSPSITRRPLGRGWTSDTPGDADTHNLAGLSSKSNCPGKRRNLPRHAQGAAHAPTGNRLSTEPAMGGNRQCNPVLHHLPPAVLSPFSTS